MKDEVLDKALAGDPDVIPRYDIIDSDGNYIAHDVRLVLSNPVLTEGTVLNKQTLLKDTTAVLYGLSAESAVPDDVFLAIRNCAGYSPKIRIKSLPGATIEIQNMAAGIRASYTIPITSELIIDVTAYGVYRVRCSLEGTYMPDQYIEVNETKEYPLEFFFLTAYLKVSVTEEIGATIQATHSSGYIIKGVVGIDKTCTLPLYSQGVWTYSGIYDECNTTAATFNMATGTEGTTTEVNLTTWTKLKVNVTTGSVVTISKSGVKKTAVSTDGVATFWVPPSSDTWSITATLDGRSTGGMATMTAGATKTVTLKYS